MMRALEIALTMVDPGPYDAAEVRAYLTMRVALGLDVLYLYGNVVFSLSKEGMVHMYSLGAGTGLLRACRDFIRDTAPRPLHTTAPDLGVQSLLFRLGWTQVAPGVFALER